MGYRNYGPSSGFIVDNSGAAGSQGSSSDFTTITAAVAAAPANTTIFIKPGTYTENFTLANGKSLAAWATDAFTPNVTIIGKITVTTATSVSISGIRLQTNSDAFLAITGSAASIVTLVNCYLNCTNADGITYSTSSASSFITIEYCDGNLAANFALYDHTSAGTINVLYCPLGNLSTKASSNSSGAVNIEYSLMGPLKTTGSGGLGVYYSLINSGGLNAIGLTFNGSGLSGAFDSEISSGSSSGISIGATATATVVNCVINSTATNAITGAGAITSSNLTFAGSTSIINVTTQTVGAIQGLIANKAATAQNPSAGYIGETISNSASAVATTSTNQTTITSINLTPGVWDISGMASSVATGGAAVMSSQLVGISPTNNALAGTLGIDYSQTNVTAIVLSGFVPQYRIKLAANATYYLVVENVYTSTTCPTNGRIAATRVG